MKMILLHPSLKTKIGKSMLAIHIIIKLQAVY